MKNRPLLNPLSKAKLRLLIKTHGLQVSTFHKSLFIFDWEGLEYQFHLAEEELYLYCVRIEWDVSLGSFDDYPKY